MAIRWLLERMAEWKNETAFACPERVVSYQELLEGVDYWKEELSQRHFQGGEVVALLGDYTPGSVSLMLALIDLGAILVPLTEAVRVHCEEFFNVAEVEAVISFDSSGKWIWRARNTRVTNALTLRLRNLGESGLVVFTSGSTGQSKAVLHSFTRLLEKFMVQSPEMVTLTFLLLDHLGGINTLFSALSSGGTVVSAQNRDPDAVCEAIERYGVELLPTSPTFLNLLLVSEAYKQYDLSSLKLITYGTEIMPQNTLQRISELFPNVKLQQTYGLSELGVLRSKSRGPGSLWVKVGGEEFETKIVDSTLWVRAKSAMLGYLNAPSPFDEDGWMNTGDTVEVDGEYIRILGRQSEIINVGGQKVHPAEVENVLMQMPGVADVVVYGDSNALLTTVAAKIRILVPESLDGLKRRVRSFCRDRLAPYKIPVRINIAHDDLFSFRYKKTRMQN